MTKSMAKFGVGAAALLAAAGTASAQDVYSFGDSLSDIGNVEAFTFGLVAGDDYFDGRFSNGFIWTDYLSAFVAGELQRTNPGLVGPFASGRTAGYNFAHGGAVSGNNGLNFNEFFAGRIQGTLLELLPPFVLTEQAEHFRDQRFFFSRTFRASSNDLATISSGGNDYFNGETDVNFVVGSIIRSIDIIEDNRINNFIVLDLPNIGDIPARFDSPNRALLNSLSQQHNALLRTRAAAIESQRGISVDIVPVGLLFDLIVADADTNGGATFGFDVVRPGAGTTGHCLGDGLVLSACPTTYLFYDDIHPTARAQAIIGNLAIGTLFASSAATVDSGSRIASVSQTGATQARLVSARLTAAGSGDISSGFFSDGLATGGGAPGLAGGGLGFRELDSGAPAGGLNFFRYVDGAAPDYFEVTPGDLASGRPVATSLTLSQGEYVSAYGADGFVSANLFLGASAMRASRDNAALLTERDDETTTYAAYAGWFDGPLSLSLLSQFGEVEHRSERATGFATAPVAFADSRTRFSSTRIDAAYAFQAGPVALAAVGKLSTSEVKTLGYQEAGGLGLVDVSAPDRTFTGVAGYLGATAGGGLFLSKAWRLDLDLDAGALAADSRDLGFAALIDTPGLLPEEVGGQRIFASEIRRDRFGGVLGAALTLAGDAGFALRAEGRALRTGEDLAHAARLNAVFRF